MTKKPATKRQNLRYKLKRSLERKKQYIDNDDENNNNTDDHDKIQLVPSKTQTRLYDKLISFSPKIKVQL